MSGITARAGMRSHGCCRPDQLAGHRFVRAVPAGCLADRERRHSPRRGRLDRAGTLGGVATLGLTMFTRWIPVHRAYVAAEAKAGRSTEFDFPAERAFPVSLVAGHGLLAV